MEVLHTDQGVEPSAREKLARDFAEWVAGLRRDDGRRVFSAPYGVIEGLTKTAKGKQRGVTFGVARISDIHLSIYSPKYMVLRDSRYGDSKHTEIETVKAELRDHYHFKE